MTRLFDRTGTLYLPLALYGLFTLVPFYSMVVLSLHAGGSAAGAFASPPPPLSAALRRPDQRRRVRELHPQQLRRRAGDRRLRRAGRDPHGLRPLPLPAARPPCLHAGP